VNAEFVTEVQTIIFASSQHLSVSSNLQQLVSYEPLEAI